MQYSDIACLFNYGIIRATVILYKSHATSNSPMQLSCVYSFTVTDRGFLQDTETW